MDDATTTKTTRLWPGAYLLTTADGRRFVAERTDAGDEWKLSAAAVDHAGDFEAGEWDRTLPTLRACKAHAAG